MQSTWIRNVLLLFLFKKYAIGFPLSETLLADMFLEMDPIRLTLSTRICREMFSWKLFVCPLGLIIWDAEELERGVGEQKSSVTS